MYYSNVLAVIVLVTIIQLSCQTPAGTKGSEHVCLEEFYPKYCAETDNEVLKKIDKCEEKNPPEIKKIEDSCYEKVKGELDKTVKDDLKAYQKMECDPILGEKFEKCMNETLTPEKIKHLQKDYPENKLGEIAKEIMYCDCDVYGIKHEKN